MWLLLKLFLSFKHILEENLLQTLVQFLSQCIDMSVGNSTSQRQRNMEGKAGIYCNAGTQGSVCERNLMNAFLLIPYIMSGKTESSSHFSSLHLATFLRTRHISFPSSHLYIRHIVSSKKKYLHLGPYYVLDHVLNSLHARSC